MSDGFDFLGFRIRWKRKRGTNKWHVYTFIADRPIRSLKAKIRALTHRTSQADRGRADPAQPDHARLGQLLQARRGKAHLRLASHFAWWRDRGWCANCTAGVEGRPPRFTTPPGGGPIRRTGSNCSTRPRCRSPDTATGATRSPTPGPCINAHGRNRGEPGAVKAARRVRRAAWGNGPEQSGHRAPGGEPRSAGRCRPRPQARRIAAALPGT